MSDEGRAPYVVEVESEGCERCCAGRMWTVVGPDDVALSTSFADQEHVEWIAEQMAHAYRAGQSAARADVSDALERLTAERDRLKAALEQAHRVIEQCNGLIDCDEHPALSAEIAAILAPCDETGQCPTVPAALRGEGRAGER